MIKVYKRTIHTGQKGATHKLESSVQPDNVLAGRMKISNWLKIPAMVAGAIVGTLVFSVFFAAILIPLGLLGIRAWLKLEKLKYSPMDQSIEAEYTVVTHTTKKEL